jgi:hypothetical protein
MGGPQSRPGRREAENNFLPLPGIEPRLSLYRLSYRGCLTPYVEGTDDNATRRVRRSLMMTRPGRYFRRSIRDFSPMSVTFTCG